MRRKIIGVILLIVCVCIGIVIWNQKDGNVDDATSMKGKDEMSVSMETVEPLSPTDPMEQQDSYIADGYEYSASGQEIQ